MLPLIVVHTKLSIYHGKPIGLLEDLITSELDIYLPGRIFVVDDGGSRLIP